MPAPFEPGAATALAPSPAAQRARRANVARRLVEHAPDAAAALDWDALDRAPDWLALSDAELAALQRRIGALLHAGSVRLWIDGARLAAARHAVGDGFLAALLSQPSEAPVEDGGVDVTPLDSAAQVGPGWQAAGASVLLASLAPGTLRLAAAAVLAPASAAAIAPERAAALVRRAATAGAGDEPARSAG